MKTRLKFFFIARVIAVFFMGLVVAIVVALSQVNLETLRGDIVSILQNATGLPIEIKGAVSWKFSLRPRIELNEVRIPNAEWAHHEYAFSAERIDVSLNLISLFQGRPTIQNVRIYDATISLERNAKGEYSIHPSLPQDELVVYEDDDEDMPLTPEFPFADPGLGGVEIRNLTANIFDKTYTLAGFNVRYMPRGGNREYAGWIKPIEEVYPFIISFSPYNAENNTYPTRVALSTGGNALIGTFALAEDTKIPNDFNISGDITDTSGLGHLLNMDLSYLPKLNINLAGGLQKGRLIMRSSSFSFNGTQINFSGEYNWSRAVPYIALNLDTGEIDLLKIFPDLYMRSGARPDRPLNVFHDIPLFGQEIRKYNLKLHIDIDKLIMYRDLSLENLDVKLKASDGNLDVAIDTDMAGGNIRAVLEGTISPSGELDAYMAGRGRDVSVGGLLKELRVMEIISDLPVNFDTYVVARGKTLSDIMHTITGPARLYSSAPGYAHSALVSYMYGADFLTSLRHTIQDLFASEKKHDQIKISCVAVNVKLRDGDIESRNGIAAQTNAINVRLGGDLNLGNETMDLALTTVPVRGIKLSLTGNVVNSMEISGSLAEPDVRINGAAVAGKVASATGIGLLLAPFTGGIGLVAGAGVGLLAGDLLENWLADDTPCETALTRGAPEMRGDPEWMNIPLDELVERVFNK